MKNAFRHLSEIKNDIQRFGGPILLFDFDGVLSAIAPTPDDAFLSESNRSLLKECAELFPTTIVTGRSLEDVKSKVNLNEFFYIASHGLEWEENGKQYFKSIPKKIIKAIKLAEKRIIPLKKRYPGMVFEKKPFMFGVHYRIMNLKLVSSFKKEIISILKPIVEKNNLRLDHNKKTFELRPEIDWDKGDSVLFARDYFQKKVGRKLAPIYIGDGLTDEDAFRTLKNGVTIRVRPKKGSAAKYYFKSRKEVDKFLYFLSKIGKEMMGKEKPHQSNMI